MTIAKSLTALLAIALAAYPASAQAPHAPPDRLLYCATNLQVDTNVDKLTALIRRAKADGYTGVLLADSKFARLASVPDRYQANCAKVKAAAAAAGLEIIPAVFPIGYSGDLLYSDPNLAEALPVRDALFVVRNGEATIEPEPAVSLPGSDMSDLKKWAWHDETVVADAGAAKIQDPRGQNARIVAKLILKPFRQYHVSVRVRTKDFKGTPEIKALVAAKSKGEPSGLIFSSLEVKPNQDWTVHHAVFNSLENAEVNLYLGVWNGTTGSLWFDDAKIEEVCLLNVVRRPGAPLSVRLEGADRPLVEGVDFEPIADPKMGTVPWPGGYEVYHQPPTIKLKKRLAEGTRLRVSCFHTVTVNEGQVMICPSEPKTLDLLRDQAERLHAIWHAKGYWMSHDEVRCLNQCDACRKRNLSPGAILADNTRSCASILRKVNPGGRIYVWSDMFDPGHNAKPGYYLVRGDLAGSWDGLDKDVIVGVWGFGNRAEAMRFFADRGNPIVIAGYYDGPPGRGVTQITQWLNAVPKNASLRGVMYTTWENRYDDLAPFARAAWGK